MDRDNRWDRVELAYKALTQGEGVKGTDAAAAVQASYDDDKTDEFVLPTVIEKDGKPVATISDKDSVVFFNFRPDRAREITRAFCDDDFKGFERAKRLDTTFVCKYDVIIINFANPDMVGHTGVEAAAIKAVETVDACVGKAVEAIKEVDGQLFICADHGNAEQLVNYETGEPWTAHTTNPVPFILVNADPKYTLRENGCLADIVPTLIQLMGMEQPKEMTGESLLVEK